MADMPLPEPARVAPVLGVIQNVYTAEQMRVYAAAVSATKGARIKVLEDALHGIFNTAGMHPVHQEQAIKRARAALVNKNG